ncbi:methyl-accepting chemotaxis protein [Desulfovibrio sp. OttesenSCG-928-G15]|nr:methyl-accepting chemotaxis protein [Desulfovibrio sp. OttesenSCG-928-G15]
MKLIYKILLPVTFLIVLLVGGSGYIAYTLSANSLEQAVIANMEDEATALQRMTATVIGNSRQNVITTAANRTVRTFFECDINDQKCQLDMSDDLIAMLESYKDIDRINVFDVNGIIVSSSNPNVIGQDFKTRPYFTEALKGNVFISAPFQSSITKQGVIIISSPVRNEGKIVGVVNATIPLPAYYEEVIKPVSIGARGYAYAMDSKGRIVVHNNPEWLFREDLPGMDIYRNMATAKQDGSVAFTNAAGLNCFAYHVKDNFSGMTLVVQAERDDVFADLDKLAKTSMLIVVISILLGALLLFILIRPIVKALNKSVVFASEIAQGNLDGQLDVKRSDEIGILGDALRSIPSSLKNVVDEYAGLAQRIEAGDIEAKGNPDTFPGQFASLITGTNNMLSQYQAMLNALTAPVLVLDKDLRVTYMNDKAKALAGSSYAGRTSGQVMGMEDYNKPECAIQKAASSLRPASAETIATPQGNRLDIEYTAIPFTDSKGQLATILQLITDLTQIKNSQRVILEVANEAGDIANRVAAASEELAAQINQATKGAEIQRDRAASTATAMEEMNSTVLEVARNAGAASEQATATSQKANDGAQLVNEVINAINQVNAVSAEVDVNMRSLGEMAEASGSVLSAISEVADQTNLLALNAAIEAARAGEAGRGFAVVADEVRKLAEKTMQATSEVEKNIKNIQTATHENVERVSRSAESTVKATEVAASSGTALSEILSLAQTNMGLVASIAAAAEEQSATSEEINRSVDDINRIANETATGMNMSAQSVQELSGMAQQLNNLLARLRQ